MNLIRPNDASTEKFDVSLAQRQVRKEGEVGGAKRVLANAATGVEEERSRFHVLANAATGVARGWSGLGRLGIWGVVAALAIGSGRVEALDRPEVTFPIFQFPQDQMPRVDGDVSDWAIVPEAYVARGDQLVDDSGKKSQMDPEDLEVSVKVGWVKGMNRLYFLYEASDNFWHFSDPGLRGDMFEIVVDGDLSGGPLIDQTHRDVWREEHVGDRMAGGVDTRLDAHDLHWATHGVHAQNYHIFTPARDKEWAMAWSSASWINRFPWSNAAYAYDFESGEGGKLVLEFWVTLFDYASPEGPERAAQSILEEDALIGLSWAVIDSDNAENRSRSFWNLSREHTMYGNANYLCAFRLMPLEERFRRNLEADWDWKVVDMDRRLIAFKDLSVGEARSWKWDFGDGSYSSEQHPIHAYDEPGNYVVVLEVEGPGGKSRHSKVWNVQLK